MTDKEAIDQIKQILKECSPAARNTIMTLLNPNPFPPARSIDFNSVKIPERATFTTSTPKLEINPENEDWLKDWIKTT